VVSNLIQRICQHQSGLAEETTKRFGVQLALTRIASGWLKRGTGYRATCMKN